MKIINTLNHWLTAFTALMVLILLAMASEPHGHTDEERAAMDALIERVTAEDWLTQLQNKYEARNVNGG